jgi:uncharacterized membrane-anchored protein YhcB (DUF1043 family)
MEYAGKEKRKNDQRRPFQWWLLVIGFVLGIAVMLVVVQARTQPVNITQYTQGELAQTATYVVGQATLMVQDPLHLSATAVSLETAARDRALIDPIAQTATHIIEMATQQAGGTNP